MTVYEEGGGDGEKGEWKLLRGKEQGRGEESM